MEENMRRKVIFVSLALAMALSLALAAQSGSDAPFYVGLNLGHTIAVSASSTALSSETLYLPIHVDMHYALLQHFGLAGSVIYRLEKDGDYFSTQELGIAVGPAFYSSRLKGFFASAKFGLAVAAGKDYLDDDYMRIDAVIQPEVGLIIPIGGPLALTLGCGLQTLLPIYEYPSRYDPDYGWDWNDMGMMSHYYLPVLDIGLGAKL